MSDDTHKVSPLAITGPALTADGTAFIVTGNGGSGPSSNDDPIHSGSLVALTKDMKIKDWYTPEEGMVAYAGISPLILTYKDKPYVVAPGKQGSVALLDASLLGGSDHHTPVFQTNPLGKPGQKHGWDGFATWQDKSGTTWVFASVSTGVSLNEKDIKSYGPTPHGAVVGFRVDDDAGKPALTPVWVSADMVNPAPPRIANGVVIALAGGNASTHASLHVLNASTGAELYSSKDEIPTDAPLAGVSVGDGHAFFTDRNNVLYSFGIGMEH